MFRHVDHLRSAGGREVAALVHESKTARVDHSVGLERTGE